MSAPTKRRGPGSLAGSYVMLGCVLGIAGVALLAALALRLGRQWAGLPTLEGNPLTVVIQAATGKHEWPLEATVILMAGLAALGALVALFAKLLRGSGSSHPIDRAAPYMATKKQIGAITRAGVEQKALQLGLPKDNPGVFLGRAVGTGLPLYYSWEDVSVGIAGPRVGKSTSLVVPAIADAPGCVVTTSNKRDVLDTTRAFRARKAGAVWVFDPQGVADEPASWYWNPLSFVTDSAKALELAKLFYFVSSTGAQSRNAFFDGAAESLLSVMFLAAKLEGKYLSDVYRWVTDQTDDTAAFICEKHGYTRVVQSARATYAAPDKQKGGVYGTAQQIMSFMLGNADAWFEPTGADDARPEFNVDEFVQSKGTLYLLSKEGGADAAAIVTALTVAVAQAAEKAAVAAGGRLPTPMLLVLDEAANVCRWEQLPNLYSHYGSRGISIMTILQSWSQGGEVWGIPGMKKLWTAANAKMYLGGVDEADFLEDLSRLVGEYETTSTSVSRGAGGASSSVQSHRERILDASDLRAMPRGRALLLYSGTPPVLMRTVPWMTGPHADELKDQTMPAEEVVAA